VEKLPAVAKEATMSAPSKVEDKKSLTKKQRRDLEFEKRQKNRANVELESADNKSEQSAAKPEEKAVEEKVVPTVSTPKASAGKKIVGLGGDMAAGLLQKKAKKAFNDAKKAEEDADKTLKDKILKQKEEDAKKKQVKLQEEKKAKK
jgi:hypothetical protein